MAITFRKNASRDALYALAVENGIEIPEDADRAAIIAALEAANATENAEEGESGAQDGAGGAENPEDDPDGDAAQDGAESATEGENGGSGTEDPGTAEKSAEGAQDGDAGIFAYVGPSLPNGRLTECRMFNGTFEDVKAYLADVLEDYPQVARLIVPVDKLAVYSVKVKTPGNIAHKHYNDIVSAMRNHREV